MARRFAVSLMLIILVSVLINSNYSYAQASSATETKNHSEKADHRPSPAKVTETTPLSATTASIPWQEYLQKIAVALATLILAFLLIKYISRAIILISEKTHILKITTRRLVLIAKIVLWTLVLYMIIKLILSPPIETVIIILAAVGLAISLALQDTLKNVFNGITILLDLPFQSGDKICIGSAYGQVYHIGLRRIQIITPDETIISIPSSEVTRQTVIQYNADASHSPVSVEIFLPPEIDMVEVKKIARRAAEVSRYIFLPKPLYIFFSNEIQQGRLVLKLHLQAFVLHIRYERLFRSEVTEVIIQELLSRGLLTAANPAEKLENKA
jgi:MscS family membrane protein